MEKPTFLACGDAPEAGRNCTDKYDTVPGIDPASRHYQLTNLCPRSVYSLRLKAIPERGAGRVSRSPALRLETPPLPPRVPVVPAGEVRAEPGALTFSWALPAALPCESVLGGVSWRLEGGPGEAPREGRLPLSTTSLALTNLLPGTSYSLTLTLTDPEGRHGKGAEVVVQGTTPASQGAEGEVVGAVAGVLLVLLLLLLLFCCLLRRRRRQQEEDPPMIFKPKEIKPILRPGTGDTLNSHRLSTLNRPLPPRPDESIYEEIPGDKLENRPSLAPLASQEEVEEAPLLNGSGLASVAPEGSEDSEATSTEAEMGEDDYLVPRVPTPASATEEDEEGYLKTNFQR
jgi:hypothetical protein